MKWNMQEQDLKNYKVLHKKDLKKVLERLLNGMKFLILKAEIQLNLELLWELIKRLKVSIFERKITQKLSFQLKFFIVYVIFK